MKSLKKKKKFSIILVFLLLNLNVCFTSIGLSEKEEQSRIQDDAPFQYVKSILSNKRVSSNVNQIPFLESTIKTTCGSVEKTTQIMFGQFNVIDVDNNINTGINGNDIRIQYIILPWLESSPDLQIGIRFSIFVERIGDEIKDESFILSSSILDGVVEIGYQSPLNNEVPVSLELSSFIFYNLEKGTTGITFNINPDFDTNDQDHTLSFFTSFVEGDTITFYEFMFEPPSEKQITIESTKSEGMLKYSFSKQSTNPTIASVYVVKTKDNQRTETKCTINPLPSHVEFTLGITPFSKGGGIIEYQCDTMYNSNIFIESNNMGICKYAVVKNTPKYFFVSWDPSKEQGYYHLDIDAEKTDVFLVDTLVNPLVNLSIHGIDDVSFSAFWNFTNPGDFTVKKDTSFHVDLDFVIDVWEARIDAEPIAENIKVSWLTDISGYLSIDTDWIPLQSIDLLIKGSDLGIRTQGEFMKAEDFILEWTLWPPIELNIDKSGEIDFHSVLIEVFIEGAWFKIWPWF